MQRHLTRTVTNDCGAAAPEPMVTRTNSATTRWCACDSKPYLRNSYNLFSATANQTVRSSKGPGMEELNVFTNMSAREIKEVFDEVHNVESTVISAGGGHN